MNVRLSRLSPAILVVALAGATLFLIPAPGARDRLRAAEPVDQPAAAPPATPAPTTAPAPPASAAITPPPAPATTVTPGGAAIPSPAAVGPAPARAAISPPPEPSAPQRRATAPLDWPANYEKILDSLVGQAVRDESTVDDRRQLDDYVQRLVAEVLEEEGGGKIPGAEEIRRILKSHRRFAYFTDERREELTLDAAFSQAIQNNVNLKLSANSAAKSPYDVMAADSAFEPSLATGVTGTFSESETTSSLAGANVVKQRGVQSSTTVSKFWGLGTVTALNYAVNRQSSNSRFATLNPSYTQSLTFSLTQPLLRSFGPAANEASYRQAVNAQKLLGLSLRQAKINTLFQVEQAYWNLALAYDDLLVTLVSFLQSQDLVRINAAKFKEGLVALLDLTSAEKQRMDAMELVIVSEAALTKAQDALGQLIAPSENPADWKRRFIPITRPQAMTEAAHLDPVKEIETAFGNRPDLAQAALDLDNKDIALAAARSRWWPQLDFDGNFGYQGVDRNYPQSAYEVRNRDQFRYSLGVNLTVPLGTKAGRAGLEKAEIDKRSSVESLRGARSGAIQEVRAAFLDLQSAVTRMEVTRAGQILAREQYLGEQRKLKEGMSTTFQVTEFVKQRLAASRANLKAITDAQIARSSLERAKGTLRQDLLGE
ncbi:MAG: TolC family protein [Planctomycetes bacterium]|nr:TolC family protein [Planctomycetota bacterium]